MVSHFIPVMLFSKILCRHCSCTHSRSTREKLLHGAEQETQAANTVGGPLWISDTLRHVAADLSAYQHGEGVPLDVLESFLVSLERVYRELLKKDCINGLTSGERDACELIRHSITELMSLHEVQSREPGSSCTTDCVGCPRFTIGRERLC